MARIAVPGAHSALAGHRRRCFHSRHFPMNITNSSLRRLVLALGCAAGLALLAAPAARAVEAAPRADHEAKSLPVTTSFHKGEAGEHGGVHVLAVTNTSGAALKVKASVVQSVASHNKPRTIELAEHEIAAGGVYEIKDLAADDVVTLHAEGYAKLEVKVPAGK